MSQSPLNNQKFEKQKNKDLRIKQMSAEHKTRGQTNSSHSNANLHKKQHSISKLHFLRRSWNRSQKGNSTGIILKTNEENKEQNIEKMNSSQHRKNKSQTSSPLTTKRQKSEHTVSSIQIQRSNTSPTGLKKQQFSGKKVGRSVVHIGGHGHGHSHDHDHGHDHGHEHGNGHSHGHGNGHGKKGKGDKHNHDKPCDGHDIKIRDDSILQQNIFKTMNYDSEFRLFKVFSSKPDKTFLIVDQRKNSKGRGSVAEIVKIQRNASQYVKQFQEITEANYQSFVKDQEQVEQQNKQVQRLLELSKQLQDQKIENLDPAKGQNCDC